jgi:hypothetical protein
MRSEGFTVTDIALELGLPYKTVESLLSRARSGLRAVAKSLAGVAAVVWAARRYGPRAALAGLGPAVAAAFVLAAPTFGGSTDGPRMATALLPGASTASYTHAADARSGVGPQVAHTAVRMAAARPIEHTTPAQPITPRLRPAAGPVNADIPAAERRHPDEDTVESIRRCLADGPEVTPENVGCKNV